MNTHKKFSIQACLGFCLFIVTSLVYAIEGGIEVTGIAKVNVVPDMARFSFSINGRGKDLVELKRDIDQKTADLVDWCKGLGIKVNNISSSEMNIHPQYNFQTKSFVGYEVIRNIKVTLDELGKYTELLNGAISSGITTIQSIVLDVKNREELERKSLAAAINAARQKAEIIAESTGVRLGNVVNVREGGPQVVLDTFRFQERASNQASMQGAFEPGDIAVTATVVVKYSIRY